MGESCEMHCSRAPFSRKNAAGPRSCRRRASREGLSCRAKPRPARNPRALQATARVIPQAPKLDPRNQRGLSVAGFNVMPRPDLSVHCAIRPSSPWILAVSPRADPERSAGATRRLRIDAPRFSENVLRPKARAGKAKQAIVVSEKNGVQNNGSGGDDAVWQLNGRRAAYFHDLLLDCFVERDNSQVFRKFPYVALFGGRQVAFCQQFHSHDYAGQEQGSVKIDPQSRKVVLPVKSFTAAQVSKTMLVPFIADGPLVRDAVAAQNPLALSEMAGNRLAIGIGGSLPCHLQGLRGSPRLRGARVAFRRRLLRRRLLRRRLLSRGKSENGLSHRRFAWHVNCQPATFGYVNSLRNAHGTTIAIISWQARLRAARHPPNNARPSCAKKAPLSRGGPSRQAASPKPRKQALKPEAERHPNRNRPI